MGGALISGLGRKRTITAERTRQVADAAGIDADTALALISQGVADDVASLAALPPESIRRSVADAVEKGIVPATAVDGVDAAVAALGRATAVQPVFLIETATLFDTTERVSGREQSEAAALVGARMDAALHEEVLAAVGPLTDELLAALEAQLRGIDHRAESGSTVADVAGRLLDAAARTPELLAEATRAKAIAAERSVRVADVLQLDAPVVSNPLLQDDLTRAKAAAFADLAGLKGEGKAEVIRHAAAVLDTEAGVTALLASGVLPEESATRLREVIDLSALTGDNLDLVAALRKERATSFPQLAGWEPKRWQKLMASGKVALPPGETAASYSKTLARGLELAFPTQALIGRAGRPQLVSLQERQPDLDLRLVDFTTAGAADSFDWGQIKVADRPAVRAEIQTFQRVMALSDETAVQLGLLQSGHTSALSIAELTFESFHAASGLAESEAAQVYSRAQDASLSVSHAFGSVVDVIKDAFKFSPVTNVDPKVVNDLQKIEGFADLFGSQDFCDCSSCRSMLSPAAYFVDLMHFVQVNVSKPVFSTPALTTHPLYLRTRRPDLWTLQLTCENTNTVIPYLTIVNEVLESALSDVVGGDIFTTLADPTQKRSFTEPFNLPWEKLTLYLNHFRLTPADLYRVSNRTDAEVRRARVGLSPDELGVITTPDPAGALTRIGSPPSLVNYPVQEFLRVTGLARDDLDDLRQLRRFTDLASSTVGTLADAGGLQNFREVLTGLTGARLDVIHRVVRLARRLGWPIADLDVVLTALRDAGITGVALDTATVEALGRLVELQPALRLSNRELTVLFAPLPVSAAYPLPPRNDAERGLYEAVFDLPQLFGLKDATTREVNQTTSFHHYSLDANDPTDTVIDPRTPVLLGALGITETELLLLMALLKDSMPFDSDGNCTLDRDRLSLLYRHVRVSRALRIGIEELVRSLHLLYPIGDQTLSSIDKVAALIDFRRWVGTSRIDTGSLLLALTGVESSAEQLENTPESTATLVAQLQSAGGDLLANLRRQQASALGLSTEAFAALEAWLPDSFGDPAVATALTAPLTNGVPDNPTELAPLTTILRELERVALVVRALKLAQADILYLSAQPAALGIADLAALTLDDVRRLSAYRALCQLRPDGATTVAAALDAYVASGGVTAPADRARLAQLWQVEPSLVDSIADTVTAGPVAIETLRAYAAVLAVCVTLGVNAYSLDILARDATFGDLVAAADVALGCFSSKYADPAVRQATLEPYLDRINVLTRDALCAYILSRQPTLKFATRDDIYAYFLLDVEMSGCFRISRVVAAISSVQLYVQRCLTNLERSDPALNPGITDVRVAPSRVPAEEWGWRKNYRVWEANRRVFLYAHAYIDPTLRDDKTPQFVDLENTLLQQTVTEESAERAYAHYLRGFADLAHLRICGSLYDKATGTYWFFGRTQQDPPAFYSRTWDRTTWTPWQKIDLTIDAPTVSAAIHRGRLFLFWATSRVDEHSSINGGSSQFDYYSVKVGLTYSALNADGTWLAPQKLEWLFPSATESMAASEKIFSDHDLAEMHASKSFLRAYPHVAGGKILLRYFNRELNQNFYFDRRLELFNNRLHNAPSGSIPGLGTDTAVILFSSSKGAALGIEKREFGGEQSFDGILEQSDNISTPHTLVTGWFPHALYQPGDPTTDYVMQYVAGGFPESVFAFDSQQFLIHDVRTRFRTLNSVAAISDGVMLAAKASPILQKAGAKAEAMAKPLVSKTLSLSLGTASFVGNSVGAKIFTQLPKPKRRLVRLSTSLADDLGEILAGGGLDELFALTTQQLHEKPPNITFTSPTELAAPADDTTHLDLKGPFGSYYTELFLHIPWLIAHHANATNQFAFAKQWYDRFFDPTADSSASDIRPSDRVWRFVGFRGLTVPKLKEILTDKATIAAYKKDPFNPHAIARLRPSAYQKAAVKHYVDNLLDWGDSLFAQDTMESINEATMLYVLALEILGPRPVKLGACETPKDAELTYEKLGPLIDKGSEFLLQLETWSYVLGWNAVAVKDGLSLTQSHTAHVLASSAQKVGTAKAAASSLRTDVVATMVRSDAFDADSFLATVVGVNTEADLSEPAVFEKALKPVAYQAAVAQRFADLVTKAQSVALAPKWFGSSPVLIKSSVAFCVPPDKVLLAYWDRVEDRLFKIRNCMNISGVRRSLSLFSPEIDPMALVRARAAGLSLDEITSNLAAPLPPYRFTALIDRARQATQVVQTFGAGLLSALEKKDIEELTLLRSVHERAVLQQTTAIRTAQVEDAEDSLKAANEGMANAQVRIDHFSGLLQAGLNSAEITQQMLHLASMLDRIGEAGLQLASAITYLVPQAGSPFAMKYGGDEVGHSLGGFASFTGTMAGLGEGASAAAGAAAGYWRRAEEWDHLRAVAEQDLKQLEQQRDATAARLAAVRQELEVHRLSIEQAEELDEFHRGKFTNLGRYDYLSSSLNRTYRAAYTAAYEIASMAAEAYRFESDDTSVFVAPDNWRGDQAGLLAGERLALQLQQLENAFLTGHRRTYEITQSFSLRLIAPKALLDLRAQGSCEFEIGEVLMDALYPGQYKRLIKGVRVSMPCVAGPHVNVSAKLSLTQTKVRAVPTTDPGDLQLRAVRTTPSMATSNAVFDGGVFDFGFRDERYLPFEGAGVVSSWRLELPSKLRSFDYESISDVILHISYTALDDGVLRGQVESQLVDAVAELAASDGLQRLFSLRQDFPDAFYLLTHQDEGAQSVALELAPKHFPYVVSNLTLKAKNATVLLVPKGAEPVDTVGFTLKLGSASSGAWSPVGDSAIVGSPLSASGPLTKSWQLSVPAGRVDPAEVDDILVLFSYTATDV